MTSPFAWLGVATGEPFPPTKTLSDVVPGVRPKFEQLLVQASAWGMQPKIRSAGRTCEQQNEQKKLGYSQAAMCRSLHIIGHAVDLDLSPATCATYTKLGQWWEQQGGFWGGRWTQFGPCGDMGHFHWFPGKAQAVPLSICPSDVSLAECQQIRSDYLRQAFAQTGSRSMGLGAGLLMLVVGVGFVWATLRVKPGLQKNPSAGSKRFGEYTLHATSRPHKNEWDVEAYFGDWRKAGEASFAGVYSDHELVGLKGWNVEVDPAHRKKGLARAMYAFAEEAFGLRIVPGDFQTPMGEAFLVGR